MTRECGSCSLCCKVMGIADLDKPPGVWCGHFARGAGCGIYQDRPTECRTFACEWLKFDGWDAAWKPDKARFVMFTQDGGRRLKVVVDPVFPDAWRREPYYSRFKRMSQTAVDGRRVFITIGQRHIIVFPDQDHDLGLVPETAQIVSGINETPTGLRSYARVALGSEPAA